MLQVRQQLADKGEDHPVSSLPRTAAMTALPYYWLHRAAQPRIAKR